MLGDSWGAETSPYGEQGAYANAIASQDPDLASLIRQAQSVGEDFVAAASRVATAYSLSEQQRRLLATQISRAQQGLPAVVMTDYNGQIFGMPRDTAVALGIGALVLGGLYFATRR